MGDGSCWRCVCKLLCTQGTFSLLPSEEGHIHFQPSSGWRALGTTSPGAACWDLESPKAPPPKSDAHTCSNPGQTPIAYSPRSKPACFSRWLRLGTPLVPGPPLPGQRSGPMEPTLVPPPEIPVSRTPSFPEVIFLGGPP